MPPRRASRASAPDPYARRDLGRWPRPWPGLVTLGVADVQEVETTDNSRRVAQRVTWELPVEHSAQCCRPSNPSARRRRSGRSGRPSVVRSRREVLLLRRGPRCRDGGAAAVPRRDQDLPCLRRLAAPLGGLDVTPTLPVADIDEAVRFCEAAGFDVSDTTTASPSCTSDDQSVFDLDLDRGPGSCVPITPAATSSPATSTTGTRDSRRPGCRSRAIEDMPWGMHEFTLTDPSGNNLRIGRSMSDD